MAEAACATKPGDASAHVHLGMLKEDRKDYDGAEAAYNAAIAADPGYAPAHVALGDFLFHRCARKDRYSAAIAADPQCVDAYTGLGAIAEDAGNFEAAEAHYRAAIAADPTNSETPFILAGFLEKRAEESGDLAAAAAIYDECAQLYTISDGVDSEFTRDVQQKAQTARTTAESYIDPPLNQGEKWCNGESLTLAAARARDARQSPPPMPSLTPTTHPIAFFRGAAVGGKPVPWSPARPRSGRIYVRAGRLHAVLRSKARWEPGIPALRRCAAWLRDLRTCGARAVQALPPHYHVRGGGRSAEDHLNLRVHTHNYMWFKDTQL